MATHRYICVCFGHKLYIHVSYFIFMFIAILLCLWLAHWQWQRAQAADLRYSHYQQQLAHAAVPFSLFSSEYQKVIVIGEIQQYLLLDNQVHNGKVGWHVIAVVKTPSTSLLVNLGWHQQQTELALITPLPRYIKVGGLLKKPQANFMLQDATLDPNWPQLLQQIHLDLLTSYLGYELFPLVLYAETQLNDLIPMPISMENKFYMHIGYTVQWLLIAVFCFIGFIFICRLEQQHE